MNVRGHSLKAREPSLQRYVRDPAELHSSAAQGNPGFQALQLINGWKGAPFGTYPAAAGGAYDLVVFKGGISSGTSPTPFNLPPSFTPVTTVYVPVDLCNATKGRLMIETSGAVTIESENENFANAQCFTLLDGVSFVQ